MSKTLNLFSYTIYPTFSVKLKKWKLTNIMEKLCWYISFFHTEKIIIMGILIINPLLLPSLPLMELFIFNKILMSSVFLNRKQLFLNVALSTKFVSLSMWIKMWELDKMRRKTLISLTFIVKWRRWGGFVLLVSITSRRNCK